MSEPVLPELDDDELDEDDELEDDELDDDEELAPVLDDDVLEDDIVLDDDVLEDDVVLDDELDEDVLDDELDDVDDPLVLPELPEADELLLVLELELDVPVVVLPAPLLAPELLPMRETVPLLQAAQPSAIPRYSAIRAFIVSLSRCLHQRDRGSMGTPRMTLAMKRSPLPA